MSKEENSQRIGDSSDQSVSALIKTVAIPPRQRSANDIPLEGRQAPTTNTWGKARDPFGLLLCSSYRFPEILARSLVGISR